MHFLMSYPIILKNINLLASYPNHLTNSSCKYYPSRYIIIIIISFNNFFSKNIIKQNFDNYILLNLLFII